jgi:hypothetical protein
MIRSSVIGSKLSNYLPGISSLVTPLSFPLSLLASSSLLSLSLSLFLRYPWMIKGALPAAPQGIAERPRPRPRRPGPPN